MENTLLEVKDLVKYFNTNAGTVHAVDHVSLTIQKGQTLGVVGESGCGKTTLGRTLLNLIPPTSGDVLFEGRDVIHCSRSESKALKREMQIIFQDPYSSLDPRMNVASIIAEPLRINHIYNSRAEVDQKVAEVMETVGLAERLAGSYPHELDGGRRQRIGVARALALGPKFIVCDEPVSALDVSIQAQILNLMMDIQERMGLSYMFITHDLSVVKHISTDIAVMYLGELVEMAPSEELFSHPTHPYTKALLSAIPVPEISSRQNKREIIRGEVSSPINPKPGCRFAPRCPYAKEECRQEGLVLKEISPGHFLKCCL